MSHDSGVLTEQHGGATRTAERPKSKPPTGERRHWKLKTVTGFALAGVVFGGGVWYEHNRETPKINNAEAAQAKAEAAEAAAKTAVLADANAIIALGKAGVVGIGLVSYDKQGRTLVLVKPEQGTCQASFFLDSKDNALLLPAVSDANGTTHGQPEVTSLATEQQVFRSLELSGTTSAATSCTLPASFLAK